MLKGSSFVSFITATAPPFFVANLFVASGWVSSSSPLSNNSGEMLVASQITFVIHFPDSRYSLRGARISTSLPGISLLTD